MVGGWLDACLVQQAALQIGICPQGGRPSRALHLRNRKFPDPLGIVPLAVRRTERTTGCILNNVLLREADHYFVAISIDLRITIVYLCRGAH